jgi:hypothetical protein
MERRRFEAAVKNAPEKTAEGVGRGSAWLREGEIWAFLGANILHLESGKLRAFGNERL